MKYEAGNGKGWRAVGEAFSRFIFAYGAWMAACFVGRHRRQGWSPKAPENEDMPDTGHGAACSGVPRET